MNEGKENEMKEGRKKEGRTEGRTGLPLQPSWKAGRQAGRKAGRKKGRKEGRKEGERTVRMLLCCFSFVMQLGRTEGRKGWKERTEGKEVRKEGKDGRQRRTEGRQVIRKKGRKRKTGRKAGSKVVMKEGRRKKEGRGRLKEEDDTGNDNGGNVRVEGDKSDEIVEVMVRPIDGGGPFHNHFHSQEHFERGRGGGGGCGGYSDGGGGGGGEEMSGRWVFKRKEAIAGVEDGKLTNPPSPPPL
jgi:hypothetical protein